MKPIPNIHSNVISSGIQQSNTNKDSRLYDSYEKAMKSIDERLR